MNNNSHNTTITQKKPKRKFNFIDFLIILVVVAIIGILIYVFSPWAHIEKLWTNNKVELTYFVEIKDVDIAYVESIKKDDGVINSVNKNSLGTVSGNSSPRISALRHSTGNRGPTVRRPCRCPRWRDGL